MPRKPQVRYFATRGGSKECPGGFYARVNGVVTHVGDGPDDSDKQGPHYLAAVKKWVKLLQLENAYEEPQATTVHVLCEKYLQAMKEQWAVSTYRMKERYLEPFVRMFGDRAVSALTGDDLRVFESAMVKGREVKFKDREKRDRVMIAKWGNGGRVNFLEMFRAACRWAKQDGCVAELPRGFFHRKRVLRSSRDVVLSDDQVAAVLAAPQRKTMRALLQALSATGARPSEIRCATGRDWDETVGGIVYLPDSLRPPGRFRHKTAGTGKRRTIVFHGALRRQLADRAERFPDSPLFPGPGGRAYRDFTVRVAVRRIAETLGIPGLTSYAFRHTYATRWLLRGGPVEMLAEALGNTPAIIYKHYSHIFKDREAIRGAIERFGTPGV